MSEIPGAPSSYRMPYSHRIRNKEPIVSKSVAGGVSLLVE